MCSETFSKFLLTSQPCFHMFPSTHINLPAWHEDTITTNHMTLSIFGTLSLWQVCLRTEELSLQQEMSQPCSQTRDYCVKWGASWNIINSVTQRRDCVYFLIWQEEAKLGPVGGGCRSLTSGERGTCSCLVLEYGEKILSQGKHVDCLIQSHTTD